MNKWIMGGIAAVVLLGAYMIFRPPAACGPFGLSTSTACEYEKMKRQNNWNF